MPSFFILSLFNNSNMGNNLMGHGWPIYHVGLFCFDVFKSPMPTLHLGIRLSSNNK